MLSTHLVLSYTIIDGILLYAGVVSQIETPLEPSPPSVVMCLRLYNIFARASSTFLFLRISSTASSSDDNAHFPDSCTSRSNPSRNSTIHPFSSWYGGKHSNVLCLEVFRLGLTTYTRSNCSLNFYPLRPRLYS